LFDLGKKVIFSENLPGMDIVSLCLKLRQRNKNMMSNTENSIHKVYLIYILIFSFILKFYVFYLKQYCRRK